MHMHTTTGICQILSTASFDEEVRAGIGNNCKGVVRTMLNIYHRAFPNFTKIIFSVLPRKTLRWIGGLERSRDDQNYKNCSLKMYKSCKN